MSCPFTHLGLSTSASEAEVKTAYRKLAMRAHPDRGGTHEKFVELKRQYGLALKMVGRSQNRSTRFNRDSFPNHDSRWEHHSMWEYYYGMATKAHHQSFEDLDRELRQRAEPKRAIEREWLKEHGKEHKFENGHCTACEGQGKVEVLYGVHKMIIRCPTCKGASI